jgi:hypothetical protein
MPDLSAVEAAASAMRSQGRPEEMVDAAFELVVVLSERNLSQLSMQNALATARELAVHLPAPEPVEGDDSLREG